MEGSEKEGQCETGDYFYEDLADSVNYNTLSILRIRSYFSRHVRSQ